MRIKARIKRLEKAIPPPRSFFAPMIVVQPGESVEEKIKQCKKKYDNFTIFKLVEPKKKEQFYASK